MRFGIARDPQSDASASSSSGSDLDAPTSHPRRAKGQARTAPPFSPSSSSDEERINPRRGAARDRRRVRAEAEHGHGARASPGRFGLAASSDEEDWAGAGRGSERRAPRMRTRLHSSRDPLSPTYDDRANLVVGISAASPSAKLKAKSKGKEKERGKEAVRLTADVDDWDTWDMLSRQDALLKAHSRTAHLAHTLASASTAAARQRILDAERQAEADMLDIQDSLRTLEVGRREEDDARNRAFEERRKALWESIESSIRAAEEAAAQAQAAALAKANRERQEALARAAAEQKAQAEAAARAEAAAADKKRREAETVEAERAAREAEEKAVRDASSQGLVDGLGVKRAEWAEWTGVMREVKEGVIVRLKADDEKRKAVGRTKRSITVRIGQVVNTRQSIVGITDNIHQQISAALPAAPSAQAPTSSAIAELPLEYAYLLSHVAKALIKQAEAEINAKPEAAYPLAKLTVGLMMRGHAAFGRILFARLVKKCCWVVPYYPAKQEAQSDADYRKSVGHKELSPPESDIQYTARMSSIITLYLAIASTPLGPIAQTLATLPANKEQLDALIPAPFRIAACWSWLAGILRPSLSVLRPVPDYLRVALETMGSELLAAYQLPQVAKVIRALWVDGLGVGGDEEGSLSKESVAGKASLRLFLEPVVSAGSFPANQAKVWEL